MRSRSFLTLWTFAVVAATSAFVFSLALRVRSIELGYELGQSHAKVARLREVKRVLELELASYKTPERIDFVARALLGMSEPSPDRILPAGPRPRLDEEPETPGANADGGDPDDDAALPRERRAEAPKNP
jgi:cell division protein FtsL